MAEWRTPLSSPRRAPQKCAHGPTTVNPGRGDHECHHRRPDFINGALLSASPSSSACLNERSSLAAVPRRMAGRLCACKLGLAYSQMEKAVTAMPSPNKEVGLKSNSSVETKHVHSRASTWWRGGGGRSVGPEGDGGAGQTHAIQARSRRLESRAREWLAWERQWGES